MFAQQKPYVQTFKYFSVYVKNKTKFALIH
jgi:hypothetical protein